MEIKDYVKQFRDLQKSHKKVRVADFCRENMLDYYEMVEALNQEKFEMESYDEQVQCGDLVITEIPESNEPSQPKPSTEGYIKEVMLSFPKGLKLTVREITPSDLTDAQETKIQEKDSEVLRLLNQIATDMIRKSDVDCLIEEAVAKATAALKADYEERMKAMAAEYEAKIAEIQNQKKDDKGSGKDQNPGKSTKNARKKGNSIICSTKEEAMQRLQEEMNKAAIMQEQAFGKGSEKLSDEERQKECATNVIPVLNDMYNDLLYYANAAAFKCGELLMKAINYAKAEWKGLIRYTEDGRYRVDNNAAESIMRDLACGRKNFLFCGSDNAAKNLAFAYSLTESCKLNNINPYDYWSDLIDFIGCKGIDLNSFVHSQWHKHAKAV